MDLPTLPHAVLAETLGVLCTLGFRRGGHRARPLGLVAICFYNLGLVLLWICTGRQDALYDTVPVGVSISLLARIYRTNMSRAARRGLRAAGSLLIYLSTYYQVVQFDQGLYPLLLGGFTLAGSSSPRCRHLGLDRMVRRVLRRAPDIHLGRVFLPEL